MRTTALARVALFFLLALAGSAVAQIDARSQALLDGLMQDQQAAAVETLDQTMVMTMYSGGTETVSSTRTVIDYVNRRAVIFTDLGEGMMARLVHVDGVTTMRMEGMPMAIPVPPGMGSAFDAIFDPAQTLSDDPDATAVYDGQVSYGDLVSGQQVTYTASYDVMGTSTESTSRFVFDEAGELLATISDGTDGSLTVMVFDPPTSDSPYVGRGSTMYDFKDGAATVTAVTRYENVVVNQPLDETLFQ